MNVATNSIGSGKNDTPFELMETAVFCAVSQNNHIPLSCFILQQFLL